MGLEAKGTFTADPADVDASDLPRQITINHKWRHTPDPAQVRFRFRVAPAFQQWYTLAGADAEGWVQRPAKTVDNSSSGTPCTHKVTLDKVSASSSTRLVGLKIEGTGPDNMRTRNASVRVSV